DRAARSQHAAHERHRVSSRASRRSGAGRDYGRGADDLERRAGQDRCLQPQRRGIPAQAGDLPEFLRGHGGTQQVLVAGGASVRLLVVDDGELDRLAVRRCIQQSGIGARADEAQSAEEALACLAGAVYDCVLLDYYIPGEDSLALLRQIREAAPGTPVIVFTGRGDEDIAVELMKAGVADYLPKGSLAPERLAAGVRHALEVTRAARAREHAEAELRAEEARFRTLANAIPQLAWMADAEGQRYWGNQRWYDYTG